MKESNSFIRALERIDTHLQRANVQSAAVRWAYEAGDREEAYKQALTLEENSEKITLLTRVLPAYTGHPRARDEVEKIMEENIPVQIGFTGEGWFCVRIPALLPKKEHGSADYIRSYLFPAMRRFFRGKQPVKYADCVLIYRHVYSRDRPERQWRDHDNIEINMVTDIVALYVMPDDCPKVCSHYYCSAAGSEDRTEVYVVPKEDFPAWLKAEKNMPDEGVNIFEKCLFQPKEVM